MTYRLIAFFVALPFIGVALVPNLATATAPRPRERDKICYIFEPFPKAFRTSSSMFYVDRRGYLVGRIKSRRWVKSEAVGLTNDSFFAAAQKPTKTKRQCLLCYGHESPLSSCCKEVPCNQLPR